MPTTQLPEGIVHYREQGSGEPMILLHANPGDSLDFAAVTTHLSTQFRVIAIDWPGYGLSPGYDGAETASRWVNVLQAFIERLGLRAVHLLGNSVGGNVAFRYAVRAPHLVRTLTLVSSGGWTDHNPLTRCFCRMQSGRWSLPTALFAAWYLRERNDYTRAMLERARTIQSRVPQRALARQLWRDFLAREYDLRTVASRLQTPTLMVFGEHDPVIQQRKDAPIAAKHVPGALVRILPCGHAPFAEMPAHFLQTLNEFLRSVDIGSHGNRASPAAR